MFGSPCRSVLSSAPLLLLLVAGCHKAPEDTAPPRARDPVPVPKETSFLAIPLEADANALRQAVEKVVPRTLWTINRPEPRCIPPQKVHIFGSAVKVTPKIGCTIVGSVTRGPVTLRGEGKDIVADVPVHARISARDVAGVLKGETATGSALVHARIRIDIARNWTARGAVRLQYDWTTPPGIDFLGQRIRFTDEADEKLRPIVAKLERDLPRELARMNLRGQAAALWRETFTTFNLNEKNPPVWIRVSPTRIFYKGYAMNGTSLRVDLGMEATTETFVGNRPAKPRASPLPPLDRTNFQDRLVFFLPVTADYRQLEPVIAKALAKRARRSFDLPGIGPVMARFDRITCYGATGGRIAVGVDIVARPADTSEETRGRIWMAARPVNAPNSPQVSFVDPIITGTLNGAGGQMLIAIGQSPGFSNLIAMALGQNFSGDIADLKGKIARAIAHKREGDFIIQAHADRFDIGRIHAYGQGLHLPVKATGKAVIQYRPK